ncbi:MAG: hypothetical protein KC505_07295 [Myxococcales bacterium]|nr:hypothetical protein [Myxococcales bacterium]USN50431.1 MAG: phosphoribosyltransferase [Myxococcales bacterium]
MLFQNRAAAAHLLAKKLTKYGYENPLILAIPRGGVPMAKIIAQELHGQLDIVLVHKLCAPLSPEYAIGSVDENGNTYLNDCSIDKNYPTQEINRQLKSLKLRRQLYSLNKNKACIKNRTVIIVDDGIATGSTLKAAIKSIRSESPKRIIAACAVAPKDALAHIKILADQVICLHSPAFFGAVGEFFKDFTQVSDDEVIAVLQGFSNSSPSA